jgi:STAS domain
VLDAAVRRHCQDGGRSIVADLSGVPAVDLAGLGALLDADLAVRQASGVFKLAGITKTPHPSPASTSGDEAEPPVQPDAPLRPSEAAWWGARLAFGVRQFALLNEVFAILWVVVVFYDLSGAQTSGPRAGRSSQSGMRAGVPGLGSTYNRRNAEVRV